MVVTMCLLAGCGATPPTSHSSNSAKSSYERNVIDSEEYNPTSASDSLNSAESSFERKVLGSHEWGETDNESKSRGTVTSFLGCECKAHYICKVNGLSYIWFDFDIDDYETLKSTITSELGTPYDSDEDSIEWIEGSISYELERVDEHEVIVGSVRAREPGYSRLEVKNDRYE